MRSKTCQFQQIFKHRNTRLLPLFSIISPWQHQECLFNIEVIHSESQLPHAKWSSYDQLTTEVCWQSHNMMPCLCQTLVEVVYLIFIMLSNKFGGNLLIIQPLKRWSFSSVLSLLLELINLVYTLRKKFLYLKFFWFIFSRIQTEYVCLRIQSKCGKIRVRKILNTDTIDAVIMNEIVHSLLTCFFIDISHLLNFIIS